MVGLGLRSFHSLWIFIGVGWYLGKISKAPWICLKLIEKVPYRIFLFLLLSMFMNYRIKLSTIQRIAKEGVESAQKLYHDAKARHTDICVGNSVLV